MSIPVVAIVGRPNVGKSTLFNRLAGRRIAVVSDIAGTTRDRVSTDVVWGGRRFILVDTGGITLEGAPDATSDRVMLEEVQKQTAAALRDADLVVFVGDIVDGVTPPDRDAADLVRRSGKPAVVVANKADNPAREQGVVDFFELGLGDPISISAYHDVGIRELTDAIVDLAPGEPEPEAEEDTVRIAIVGRPNVGKSELFNALTGQQRAIVSPIAGTTRDSVDTPVRYGDRDIVFVDTAGLRRRGRAQPGIEQFSVIRTIQSIERCHVALLVLDASEFVTAQDSHVAGFVEDAGRGCVVVVNKWDLVDAQEADPARRAAIREIEDKLKFLEGTPVLFTSALHRRGIGPVLTAALGVFDQWTKALDPGDLKRSVLDALAAHPPPTGGKGRLRISRVEQVRTGPPTFVFFSNDPDRIHFSYRRYLANRLRERFGFEGCPLRLEFRKGK